MRINAGHLSKILVKAVTIEDIVPTQRSKHLTADVLGYKMRDRNSLSDKSLILAMTQLVTDVRIKLVVFEAG
jgi:hypothetical protein